MTRLNLLRLYLLLLGLFTTFWWPLSHWFYPDWYHRLLGFGGQDYDYSLVKIIGTLGVVQALGMFLAARDPVRNRDLLLSLLVFFVLLAGTYVFLIEGHGFPRGEYANVALLAVNTVVLGLLFPRAQPERRDRQFRISDRPAAAPRPTVPDFGPAAAPQRPDRQFRISDRPAARRTSWDVAD